MVGQSFQRRCDIGSGRVVSAKLFFCTAGLLLTFGGLEARSAETARAPGLIHSVVHSGDPVQDLGNLPPPADADSSAPTSSSSATVSAAQPVPELPIWAMLLVFFGGLGLAKMKRGRRDRLSPGLE
jgi:hypothetical protein